MADAALKTAPAEEAELTDGFNLLIDALKLNGLTTIYGVPGIPITDFGRMAQASGIRVLSFRHEQNAGYAAAIAGFLTKKPGICLTVSAPGFLNGLTALAHATTNCFPMILMSGSSEREIVDLQQGDYEEMDQLAIAKTMCKAAYRILHAEDIGIGLARAIRAAVSGRPGGVYLDLPAKLFGQVIDAAKGEKSLVKVIDAAPRQDGVHRTDVEIVREGQVPVISADRDPRAVERVFLQHLTTLVEPRHAQRAAHGTRRRPAFAAESRVGAALRPAPAAMRSRGHRSRSSTYCGP